MMDKRNRFATRGWVKDYVTHRMEGPPHVYDDDLGRVTAEYIEAQIETDRYKTRAEELEQGIIDRRNMYHRQHRKLERQIRKLEQERDEARGQTIMNTQSLEKERYEAEQRAMLAEKERDGMNDLCMEQGKESGELSKALMSAQHLRDMANLRSAEWEEKLTAAVKERNVLKERNKRQAEMVIRAMDAKVAEARRATEAVEQRDVARDEAEDMASELATTQASLRDEIVRCGKLESDKADVELIAAGRLGTILGLKDLLKEKEQEIALTMEERDTGRGYAISNARKLKEADERALRAQGAHDRLQKRYDRLSEAMVKLRKKELSVDGKEASIKMLRQRVEDLMEESARHKEMSQSQALRATKLVNQLTAAGNNYEREVSVNTKLRKMLEKAEQQRDGAIVQVQAMEDMYRDAQGRSEEFSDELERMTTAFRQVKEHRDKLTHEMLELRERNKALKWFFDHCEQDPDLRRPLQTPLIVTQNELDKLNKEEDNG